jgi:hypothetical protein
VIKMQPGIPLAKVQKSKAARFILKKFKNQ